MSAPRLAAESAEDLAPAFSGSLEQQFAAALLRPFQRMADLILDDAGPYRAAFDGSIVDPSALRWAAQWAGVNPDNATEAELRDPEYLRRRWTRGSVPAVRGAIQSVLTGDRNLRMYERRDPADFAVDAPYHLTIVTTTSETPGGSASIIAALKDVLPARMVLHISIVNGRSWQDLKDSGKTWAQVLSAYTNWHTVYNG